MYRTPMIIAEIGTAHQGSFEKACQLIDAAKKAGADCVKFQWVYAHEILHPDTGFVQLPTGNIPLYDRFKELEVPPEFFARCRDYARRQGLLFMCSPFGIQSLEELWALQPDAIKIASPEVNHYPMLKRLMELETAAGTKGTIPVVISSGVSKLEDIRKAMDILSPLKTAAITSEFPPLSLLHCITSYPAPETEYNLAVLATLEETFGVPCGVSDHSLDPRVVPATCLAAGGFAIEKHITLSKETDGLDDPVALTTQQFAEMVSYCHFMADLEPEAQIYALNEDFGEDYIEEVLGSGKKELAPAEEANYGRTNRSIHVMHAMKKGDVITKESVGVLRTEKVLTVGMSPEFYDDIMGRTLTCDLTAGAGLLWEHLS